MSQTKRESIQEAFSNTIIGGVIAWGITYTVMSLIENTALATTVSVITCTIASLIRNYFIRRRFAEYNGLFKKAPNE